MGKRIKAAIERAKVSTSANGKPRAKPGRQDDGDPRYDTFAVPPPPPPPERGDAYEGPADPPKAKPAAKAVPELDAGITLAALMAADLPPPKYVVDDFLPTGVAVLAGRPKGGKSWACILLCMAVAGGHPCLGGRAVRRGPVLYLALEDTRRRLKDRASKVLARTGWPASDQLDLRVGWPRAGSGGLQALGEWMADHPGGLVVVDTLARFRDPGTARTNSYEADYAAISGLKALADATDSAVLIVTHTRKGAADDPFDEISGTLGINGAADSLLVLERTRGAGAGTLYLTGRDIAEQTLNLAFDQQSGVWSVVGRTDGIERPDRGRPASRVDACAAWLRDFLGAFAWPDAEVTEAARRAGYTLDNLKDAKAALRKADPPLSAKPLYSGGPWWNWVGHRNDRKPDRPPPHPPDTPGKVPSESPDTPETGGLYAQCGECGESPTAPLRAYDPLPD